MTSPIRQDYPGWIDAEVPARPTYDKQKIWAVSHSIKSSVLFQFKEWELVGCNIQSVRAANSGIQRHDTLRVTSQVHS